MNPLNNKYNIDFFKQYGQTLADAPDPSIRKALETAEAEQTLDALTSQVTFDFYQFVNLHLPLDAINSLLEGNSVVASINFWKSFIESLSKSEGMFLPLDITPQQLSAVQEALKDIESYNNIIASCPDQLGPKLVDSTAKNLRTFVLDSLQQKRYVYALHGYRGGPNHNGHVIPALYERKETIFERVEKIIVHPFSQGAGSEDHLVLDFTEKGEIISYRYFPIELAQSTLQRDEGLYLFAKDIFLSKWSPKADETPYSPVDVYGPFQILGKVCPNQLENHESLRKKTQAGMTCADKGVKMVVNDALIRHNTSHRTIKRLFCLARLYSIILGYHFWKANCGSDELTQVITDKFEKALSAFSVAITQRAANTLTEEEVLFCKGLALTLLNKISSHEKKQKPNSQPPPITSIHCHTRYPPLRVKETQPIEDVSQETSSVVSTPTQIELPSTRILTYGAALVKQLNCLVETVRKLNQNKEYLRQRNFILSIFNQLNHPDPEGKDTWGEVPVDNIGEVVQAIADLSHCYVANHLQLNEITRNEESCLHLIQVTFKGYCIADRLARRNPKTQLKHFYSPNWLQRSTNHDKQTATEDPFCHINDGKADCSIAKSEAYLSSIEKRMSQGRSLFHFARYIDVEDGLRSLKKSPFLLNHPAINYLTYLNQFYEEAWEKGLSKDNRKYSSESYVELWLDENNVYLPLEVNGLRKLSQFALWACNNIFDKTLEDFRSMPQENPKQTNKRRTIGYIGDVAAPQRKIADHLATATKDQYTNLFSKTKTDQNQSVLIENPIEREIGLIVREAHLHFTSLLSWLKKHPSLFEDSLSKFVFEGLLLKRQIIQKEVVRNPIIVNEFRQLFKVTIERYRAHPQVLHDIIRIAIFAETHIKAAQGSKYDDSMALYLQSALNNQPQEESILILKSLMYANLPPLTSETIEPFLHTSFITAAKCSEKSAESMWWLFREAMSYRDARQDEIKPLLIDPHISKQLCHSLLKRLVPDAKFDDVDLKGSYPIFILGQYEINFISYTIMKESGARVGYITKHHLSKVPELSSDILNRMGEWKKPNLWESLDGKYKVIVTGDKVEIEKKYLTIKGERWFRYIFNPRSYFVHDDSIEHIMSFHLCIPGFLRFWRHVSTQDSSEHFLVQDDANNTVLIGEQTSQGLTLSKPDVNGCPSPIQLIDMKKFSEDHLKLCSDLHCGIKQLRVSIFYHTENNSIESIHYRHPRLDFYHEVYEGRSLMRSKQYPAYWLEVGGRVDELGSFPYYLVLNSADQGRMVILLPLDFKSQRMGEEPVNNTELLLINHFGAHTSYFGVSETDGMLISHSPTTNLHLTYLFAFMRDYRRALKYLPRCTQLTPYNDDSFQLINNFKRFIDRSPEALAFYLRLAVMLIDHSNQPLYNRAGERICSDFFNYESFKSWASEKLYRYFQVVGFRDIHRVPIEMRLDEVQIRVLLNNLRPENEKQNQSTKLTYAWPTLNELHYTLSTLPKGQAQSFTIPNRRSYPIYPVEMVNWTRGSTNLVSAAKSLIPYSDNAEHFWIPNFVRVDKQSTLMYFIALYERILLLKNKDDLSSIDLALFYFARSIGDNQDLQPFITVLNLVRRHPEVFADLSFTYEMVECSDKNKEKYSYYAPESTMETLQKIQDRIYSKKEEWDTIIKTIVAKIITTTTIGNDLTINLSLPRLIAPDKIIWEFSEQLKQPIKAALGKPLLDVLPKDDTTALQKAQVEHSTFFPNSQKKSKTRLESYLWGQFAKGFDEAEKEILTKPIPAEALSHSAIKQKLDDELKKTDLTLASLKEEIERRANCRPCDKAGKLALKVIYHDSLRRLKLMGKQALRLEVDTILLEAIMMKDLRIIWRANPTLSLNEVHEIAALILKYYIHSSTRNRIKQALKVIHKIQKNTARISPDHQRELEHLIYTPNDIDPFEQPEVLIYCYKSSRTLRPNQMKLLKKIFKEALGGKDVSQLLFAFEAGGGKTDLLKIILKAIARRLGYIPATISPKSSISNDAEKERAALVNTFNQRAVYFEVDLQTELKTDQLIHIRAYLEKCEREKLHPMFIPETFYALALKYFVALYEKNVESVRHLSAINFKIFSQKFFAFIDEGRLTLGPLTHAMIGLGKPISLPKEERALFLKAYRELLGLCKYPIKIGNRSIADVLRIQSDKQCEASPKDVDNAKDLLANRLLNDPELSIPNDHWENVKEFWLNPAKSEPEWIQHLRSEKPAAYQLNTVLREFFTRTLSFALSQAHFRDYGQSDSQSLDVVVPKERRGDTHSFFKNPYETLALTIQGTFQRGLTKDQLQKLVEKIIESYKNERASGFPPEDSPTVKRWQSWADGRLPPLVDLVKNIDVNNSQQKIVAFYSPNLEGLCRDNEAIFWFLEEEVLPKVVYCPLSVSVDPCHLFEGFARVMATSAYPGPHELYPFKPSNETPPYIDDKIFPARVMRELCHPRNSRMITLEFDTLDEYFTKLYDQHPALFNDLCMIGDAFGMLRKFSNLDVAKAFLKFAREKEKVDKGFPHFDGVLLFHEGKSANDGKKEHHLFLQDPDGTPVSLIGHDIEAALWSQLGLRWESLKLVTYYDIEHNSGEHIPQPEKGTILFLLEEHTPISHGSQTLLRDRNFFLETTSVVWCNRIRLERKIAEEMGEAASPEVKVAWMVKNETALTANEILSRTYRQIAYLIQKPALDELKQALDDPEKQIALFHKNPQRFLEENFKDRYQEFARSVSLDDASNVLWDYAKALYQKFNYRASWSQELPVYQQVSQIIQMTADKIKQIPRRNMAAAGERARIHIHQVQHVEEHQNQKVTLDLKSMEEKDLDSSIHISSPNLCKRLLKMSRSARSLFGSPFLDSELYYTENAIKTATSAGKPLNEKFLKPVEEVLILQEEGGPLRGFALSKKEAAHFKKQFDQGMDLNKEMPKHRVLLVTTTGIFVQNGAGKTGFAWQELEQTIAFQDLLIDVALLQGRVCYPKRLTERLRTWKDIWILWDKVVRCAALPGEIHRSVVESLFPLEFKNVTIKPEQPSFIWSFFGYKGN